MIVSEHPLNNFGIPVLSVPTSFYPRSRKQSVWGKILPCFAQQQHAVLPTSFPFLHVYVILTNATEKSVVFSTRCCPLCGLVVSAATQHTRVRCSAYVPPRTCHSPPLGCSAQISSQVIKLSTTTSTLGSTKSVRYIS